MLLVVNEVSNEDCAIWLCYFALAAELFVFPEALLDSPVVMDHSASPFDSVVSHVTLVEQITFRVCKGTKSLHRRPV